MSESVTVVPLGEAVKPTRPRVKPSDYPDLPFIGMEHVEAHSMKLLGTVPAKAMKSSAIHFKPGDVLYGRLRPYLNKVYRPSFDGLCSAEFIVLPENDRIDGAYLQHFLNSAAFVRYATHLNAGDRPRVDFEQLASYKIRVPEINEQRRIVAGIEEQFYRLDEALASLARLKARMSRYRATILAAACNGSLVGLDSRKWPRRTLGEIATTIRNGFPGKPDADEGTRILRISAVRAMKLDSDDVRYLSRSISHYKESRVAPGDVLFTRYNGSRDLVGVCAVVPAGIPETIHPDKLIRVRVPNEILSSEMLVVLASAGEGRAFLESRIRTTAGQSGISGSDLKSLPLMIPPRGVQEQIQHELERRFSVVSRVNSEIEAGVLKAVRLRQSVLARAYGGAH